MKKLIILIVAVVLCSNNFVSIAAETEKELGISMEATWVSKYIWRGQDFYDDHAAFQPSINFDLYGTGFSANVWTSYAGASGFRDTEEFDYSVAYASSAFGEEKFRTDFALSWYYYDIYDAPSRDSDSQDLILDFAWPELFGETIVPNYQLSYYYAAKGGGAIAAAQVEGFAHRFGFSYDLPFLVVIDNPLTFSWDITYNDGQGSMDYDHDWSHITWGLSTNFDVGDAYLTPALYYQTSMEKSINPEDELWVGISYGFDF